MSKASGKRPAVAADKNISLAKKKVKGAEVLPFPRVESHDLVGAFANECSVAMTDGAGIQLVY
jgi:hypothetical protein